MCYLSYETMKLITFHELHSSFNWRRLVQIITAKMSIANMIKSIKVFLGLYSLSNISDNFQMNWNQLLYL